MDGPKNRAGETRGRPGARRQQSRFPASVPVECTGTGRAPFRLTGRTIDVGGGGVAVDLPRRLRRGTRLAVSVRTAIGAFRLAAEVVWTRRMADRQVRHGLCLSGRTHVVDLPVGVLLGEWLGHLASQPPSRAPRPARKVPRPAPEA